MRRDGYKNPTSWGIGSDPSTAARRLGVERAVIRDSEAPLEKEVSNYICKMPFLWLDIGDAPGPDSLRGIIERNSITLLSSYGRKPLDQPTSNWLGNFSDRERARSSGLWNSNHVDDVYDPGFLTNLEQLVC